MSDDEVCWVEEVRDGGVPVGPVPQAAQQEYGGEHRVPAAQATLNIIYYIHV